MRSEDLERYPARCMITQSPNQVAKRISGRGTSAICVFCHSEPERKSDGCCGGELVR